ncbi:hypothetical protein [Colwellia echini]|uniref:Uncharacterized protein n=1 Tax=Colwellia echini TaxID=1982103 RepID=A0ABY3N0U4_9GAMM|nr:hypothetical protein [Colwellia echini]TYK66867.1 hypothetical protein CWS31_003535 [Colwellia echini]
MLIELTTPIFKCQEDENIFYLRLNEFPHLQKVTNTQKLSGKGGILLYFTLNEVSSEVSSEVKVELTRDQQKQNVKSKLAVLAAVQEVANIWVTSFKVLI